MTLPVTGHMDSDDGDTLTDWALAGEGIVLEAAVRGGGAYRRGALVPVLEHTPPTSATLGLLYPSRKMLSARTKTFVDMAHEACAPMSAKPRAPRQAGGLIGDQGFEPERPDAADLPQGFLPLGLRCVAEARFEPGEDRVSRSRPFTAMMKGKPNFSE